MATLEGGRISSRQFLALLVLTRLLAALIDAPTISGTSVEHDAWIAVIISTVMAVPWVLLLVHLSSMYPGMTIIQYSQVILVHILAFGGAHVCCFLPSAVSLYCSHRC